MRILKIGEREVPMLASASCDIYYKRIFGEDIVKLQASDEWTDTIATLCIMKMGFVMAKFAELKSREKMTALTEDDYIDWLDGLERGPYIDALSEVVAVYNGERSPSSEPKNQEDQ